MPKVHIAMIGLPGMKGMKDRFSHYIDEWVEFPGFPGLPEQPFRLEKTLDFLEDLRTRQLDVLVQMQGNGSVVNPLLALAGPKRLVGYYQGPGAYRPSRWVIPYPEELPEVKRHLFLVNALGITNTSEQLEWPVTEADRKEGQGLGLELDKKYVCVHGGARDPHRRWEETKMARVADECVRLGYSVVLTGVKGEEKTVTGIQKQMKEPAVNLCGKTKLGGLGAVLEKARLLLSNDTGVAHIARAVGCRSVVVSLAGEQERWKPLDLQRHYYIDGFSDGVEEKAMRAVREVLLTDSSSK